MFKQMTRLKQIELFFFPNWIRQLSWNASHASAKLSENYFYWERLFCLIIWNSLSRPENTKITQQLPYNLPASHFKLNSSFTIKLRIYSCWEIFEISIGKLGKLRRYLRYYSVVTISKCEVWMAALQTQA